MLNMDLLIIIASSVQPLLVGFIVTYGLFNFFYTSGFYKNNSAVRSKLSNTKMYECATESRLSGKFLYKFYSYSTVLTFIVYDVDLLFLIPECPNLNIYSLYDLTILIALVIMFVVGIVIDTKSFTFNWKL